MRKPSPRFVDLTGHQFGELTVVCRNFSHPKITRWECRCSCGKTSVVAAQSLKAGLTTSCGHVRNAQTSIRTAERNRANSGMNHPGWKGGRWVNHDGYVVLHRAIHGGSEKYKLEHVVVMEQALGRHLFPDETVHHKNGVRHDNRLENLELWLSNHPTGQRREDAVRWAKEILVRYEPTLLKE